MRPVRHCIQAYLRMLHGIRGGITVVCISGMTHIAGTILFVWICKHIIDIVTGIYPDSLAIYIWYMVGLILIRLAIGTFNNYYTKRLQVKNQNRLRSTYFEHVMYSTWTGQEHFHSGDTMNRLEEDIRVVSNLSTGTLPQLFITVFQLLAASVFLFSMAPALAWILLITMPIAVICSRICFRVIRRYTTSIRQTESAIQSHMQEHIQHRVLIRSMDALQKGFRKLSTLHGELFFFSNKRQSYSCITTFFLSLGFMSGYAVTFLWGVFGIRHGTVTFGMMTAFLQLVGQVQQPVANLMGLALQYVHGVTSVERLMDIDALPIEPPQESCLMGEVPSIEISDLTFSYPNQSVPIFKHFSHCFPAGTSTMLIGGTGCGKSTLAQLILALLAPQSGSIHLAGKTQRIPVGPGTRCNFMYVPQANSLLSGTIRENLLLACPNATENALREALHMAVADFVWNLPNGIDTVCSETGGGLSQGQAQRIAIARALLHHGSILLFDEATSALDKATEDELLSRINHTLQGKKTMIWISHRMAVSQYTNQTLVINSTQ